MLFNSYIFIFLFLPLTLAGYYGLNLTGKYKASLFFLTGMSFWFCGYTNIFYLLVLAVSIFLNYGTAALITALKKALWRRCLLWFGILANLGLLFTFKYYDFFIENINGAFKADLPLLHLILPLGISFYTFQQLSYVIDSYQGCRDRYSLLEYAAYAAFFPKLIQGPIAGHGELISQFRDSSKKQPDFAALSRGLYSFCLGLAKKVLVADTLSVIVNQGYGDIGGLNSLSAAMVMVCYSLQIYFDFSGYCDMAFGMSLMMNIDLPLNFNSPYKAQSVSDFWDRWHMTLTRFFTRYVYIPLGGNRKGTARTYLNIMTVFLLSGLWHGANWTFILWGAMHGMASVIERAAKLDKRRVPGILKTAFTFLFVTFAWSLFRADSLSDALLLWNRLLHGEIGPLYQPFTDAFRELTEISLLYRAGLGGVMNRFPWLMLTLFAGGALLSCFFMKNTQEKTKQMSFSWKKCFSAAFLMLWSVVSLSRITEFIYFNF